VAEAAAHTRPQGSTGNGAGSRPSAPAQRRHVYHCPLRWSDMDAFGHVNNVVFLTYLEEARVDMLFHPDSPGASMSGGCLVARHEIDYKRPLVHRATPVRVEVWVTRLRAAAFELAYEVRDDDVVYATAASVLVPYDLENERPRRLSEHEREFLASLAVDEGG
jgi:acyl-CoA thioester hydrolase